MEFILSLCYKYYVKHSSQQYLSKLVSHEIDAKSQKEWFRTAQDCPWLFIQGIQLWVHLLLNFHGLWVVGKDPCTTAPYCCPGQDVPQG